MRTTWLWVLLLAGCGPIEDEVWPDRYDPDHLTLVEVELPDKDWDVLRNQGRNYFDLLAGPDCWSSPAESVFTWFEADVVVDGESLDSVGVRKKGFIGSLNSIRPSLKIDTDRFTPKQDFADNTEHLTFNNNNQDPSRMRTCLAYQVFEDAGIAAPDCAHALVTVNGQDLGVYTNIEPLRKEFLWANFGVEGGDFYEGTVSDFSSDWIQTFDIKSDGSTLAPLQELADVLDGPDGKLIDGLEEIVDLDYFITMWATEGLIGHWDGYASGRNNYYVHHHPIDGKLRFIPWGADAVFEDADSSPVFATGRLAMRLYNHPVGNKRYIAETRRLLREVWDEGALHAKVDAMDELVGSHVMDPESYDAIVGQMRDFIDGRREVIEGVIDAPPDRPPFDYPVTCLDPVGSVEVSFDTVWDSLEQDAFGFTASLEGELDGAPLFGDYAGAIAGTDAEGNSQIVVYGVDAAFENLTAVIVYIAPDLDPGTYPIDIVATYALAFNLDLTNPYAEPEDYVFLSGEMLLGEISYDSGAQVSGSVDAELMPNFF